MLLSLKSKMVSCKTANQQQLFACMHAFSSMCKTTNRFANHSHNGNWRRIIFIQFMKTAVWSEIWQVTRMAIDTDPPQMCLCTLYTCMLCLYSSVVLGLRHFAAVLFKLKTFMVLSEICLVVFYVALGVFFSQNILCLRCLGFVCFQFVHWLCMMI